MAGIVAFLGIVPNVVFVVGSFFSDEESIHRMHYLATLAPYAVLLGGAMVVCARDPESNLPAFRVAVATAVAAVIAGVISGDLVTGPLFLPPVFAAILWILYPSRRDVLRMEGVDIPTAILAIATIVPAVAFALTQAEFQRTGIAGDSHVDAHHYSGMVDAALSPPLCASAAGVRSPGRRMAAWLVGLAGVLLGAGSLALSDRLGAFDAVWAWIAIAWGVLIVAFAEREAATR